MHRIECYHMETEHYKDSRGNTKTRQKKVVTHRAAERFVFNNWVDKSPPRAAMEHIDVFLLCRLYTHKDVNYSSRAWQMKMDQERAFIDKHKNRDREWDYNYSEDIPFQASHNLVHNPKKGGKPWYANQFVMAGMDLLIIGWIPKYLLDTNSTRVEFTIEKYIIN